MDTLGSIIEVIRDYLNRCVKCSKCRQGTCPWICNFLTPEASAITENADQKTTHEARAMALYEMAGCPRETSFESDELQEYWVEEVRSNRRLFILGARWKF
ncbi:MAG: hypothetical protein J6S99_06255 [Bacteroidales bacterium]|nr:hypothetical protein [Bacteroidales bacterium]